jgi:hypothetical protein
LLKQHPSTVLVLVVVLVLMLVLVVVVVVVVVAWGSRAFARIDRRDEG